MSDNLEIKVATSADTTGIKQTQNALSSLDGSAKTSTGFVKKLNDAFLPLAAISASSGLALRGLTGFMGDSIDEANNLQGALTGLNSIARAFKQDADRAKVAAQELASDGLMTVSDSATGLKNLLASGFSLDQAIVLMKRFKDSAAFGKQSALSFGQAIRGATEGIKNGNSILVDNAGVTKNLSVILEEAGFSAQDLMKATTDANVRQAIYNGLLKETTPMLGDAERLTKLYAGSQAQAAAQTTVLKQSIGQALQVALLPLLQAITPVITAIARWVQEHQKLAAILGIGLAIFLSLIVAVGVLGATIGLLAPLIAVVGASFAVALAGIVATVAFATGAIIVNWDRVRGFFINTANVIRSVFGAVFGWLKGTWPSLIGILGGPFGQAVSIVMANWNRITPYFRTVVDAIRYVMSAVKDAIVAPFQAAYNAVTGVADKIKGVFNGITSGASNAKDFITGIKIPGFATGVRNFQGGLAVVGEEGPELVNLPKGSNVYNNSESKALTGSDSKPSSSSMNHYGDNHFYTADAVNAWYQLNRNNELAQRGLTTLRGGA